ncbi:heterokaryon incompatibility protein-domain-containing protein, partial [Podospora aff. communis PSN243]
DLDALSSPSAADREPLRGSLRVVDLDTDPGFTALSYVWGSFSHLNPDVTALSQEDKATCTRLAITTNCAKALRAVRRTAGPITIWVDAICINQADMAERSAQIPFMTDIYSSATMVYAWLGQGSPKMERFIDSINTFSIQDGSRHIMDSLVDLAAADACDTDKKRRALQKAVLISVAKRWLYYPRLIWEFVKYFTFFCIYFLRLGWPLLGQTRPLQSRLFRLFAGQFLEVTRLAWFQRGWTLQELILAPNITLLYGKAALPWYDLLRQLPAAYRRAGASSAAGLAETAYLWMKVARPRKVRPEATTARRGAQAPIVMMSMESFYAHLDGIMTNDRLLMLTAAASMFATSISSAVVLALLSAWANMYALGWYEPWGKVGMMRAIRERQTTDPKDRSFAFFGILQLLGVSMEPPDYGRSTQEIYTDLCTALLRWSPCTINLLTDIKPLGAEGAPSWVPNWADIKQSNARRTEFSHHFEQQYLLATHDPLVRVRGNSLTVRGVRKGAVVLCRTFEYTYSWKQYPEGVPAFARDSFHRNLAAFAQFASLMQKSAADHELFVGIPEAMAQLIAYDAVLPRSRRGDSLHGEDYRMWCDRISSVQSAVLQRAISEAESTVSPDSGLLETILTGLSETESSQFLRLTNLFAAHLRIEEQSLFSTDDGRTGTGPEVLSPGDEVFLIDGVCVPMVLSPVPQRGGGVTGQQQYTVVGSAYVLALRWRDNCSLEDENLEQIELI